MSAAAPSTAVPRGPAAGVRATAPVAKQATDDEADGRMVINIGPSHPPSSTGSW
jgi:hypothetical protein